MMNQKKHNIFISMCLVAFRINLSCIRNLFVFVYVKHFCIQVPQCHIYFTSFTPPLLLLKSIPATKSHIYHSLQSSNGVLLCVQTDDTQSTRKPLLLLLSAPVYQAHSFEKSQKLLKLHHWFAWSIISLEEMSFLLPSTTVEEPSIKPQQL